MVLRFFGLGVLAFEIGESHVQRFVTESDADVVYQDTFFAQMLEILTSYSDLAERHSTVFSLLDHAPSPDERILQWLTRSRPDCPPAATSGLSR